MACRTGAQPFDDEFSVNEDDKLKCRENEWKTRHGGVNVVNTSPLLYDMLYFSIQLKRSSSSSSSLLVKPVTRGLSHSAYFSVVFHMIYGFIRNFN